MGNRKKKLSSTTRPSVEVKKELELEEEEEEEEDSKEEEVEEDSSEEEEESDEEEEEDNSETHNGDVEDEEVEEEEEDGEDDEEEEEDDDDDNDDDEEEEENGEEEVVFVVQLPLMASSKVARRTQGSIPKEPSSHTSTLNGNGIVSGGREGKEYSLEDFEIIKTIGTGTFGRVCLCREKATKDFCAMKILAIADVIKLKQVEHVKNEKSILMTVHHPFIVNLKWHHRDNMFIYMLFEYVCGGELFSYLRNAGRFSSGTGCFYASEIVSALEYLHSQAVVYRDLKPENLLLDRDGHLKITDFGFAKKLTDRTWTLCGTPEYLAPEIIQSKGHNKAVDWWALGVLIYEMLAGYPPFFDDNAFGIYEKILAGKIEWPRHMDPVAKDLIKKLLVQDRTKRLGNMKNGADDVKRHRWFKGMDWDDVFYRKLKPPIVPKVSYDGDTRNFDDYPEADLKTAPIVSEKEIKLFEDF